MALVLYSHRLFMNWRCWIFAVGVIFLYSLSTHLGINYRPCATGDFVVTCYMWYFTKVETCTLCRFIFLYHEIVLIIFAFRVNRGLTRVLTNASCMYAFVFAVEATNAKGGSKHTHDIFLLSSQRAAVQYAGFIRNVSTNTVCWWSE